MAPGDPAGWTSWGAWAGTSCWPKTGTRSSIFTASFSAGRRPHGETDPADFYQLFSSAGADDRRHAHQASERAAAVLALLLQCRRHRRGRQACQLMAEAGSSRVRSNCLMVAGSRDAADPRAPCCAAGCSRREITERPSASEVAGPPVGWHCFAGQDGAAKAEAR